LFVFLCALDNYNCYFVSHNLVLRTTQYWYLYWYLYLLVEYLIGLQGYKTDYYYFYLLLGLLLLSVLVYPAYIPELLQVTVGP